MQWYMDVLRKYADFSGRARRKEYWMFTLVNVIILMVIGFIGGLLSGLGKSTDSSLLSTLGAVVTGIMVLYLLATLLPIVAVTVRRLHDIGKSGAFIFLSFVPFVGGLIMLVFTCTDSEPRPNQYGPIPKPMVPVQAYGQSAGV